MAGSVGPGGGKVFYVHPSGTFACGPTLASQCKYLEAAPTSGTNAWTDASYVWSGNTTGAIGANARGTDIGEGFRNTEAMVNQASGGDTADRAGTVSRAYRGPNNLTDWYLPARDELLELCKYARQQTTGNTATVCNSSGTLRAGFSSLSYWSSTEYSTLTVLYQTLGSGMWNDDHDKTDTHYVRPVRAFSPAG